MKTSEILKAIMKENNVTQALLVERIGDIKRSTLAMRLTQDNMQLTSLTEILEALNCKLVVIPDTAKTPKGGYVIE